MKKLHLGCGRNYLKGWINTDKHKRDYKLDDVVDVTEKLPYEDSSIDYIFSEHVIEHMDYDCGKFMLKECFRVLKPSGKIRISTPDLKFLIDLYTDNKSEIQTRYIDMCIKHNAYDINTNRCSDAFIINNFVRAWGHLFIYDYESLSTLLLNVGYSNIQTFKICESNDEHLKNIENVSDKKRPNREFLQLETFTIEATK